MATKPPGTCLELRSSLSNHVDTRTLSNRSYVDILRFALTEAVRDEIVSQVYDFSLALELES